MKVIFVTREGYNLAGGRIRAYNFAKELAKRGIETEVLSYADGLGAKDGINERLMTYRERIRYNIDAYKRLASQGNAIIVLQRINYHSFGPFLAHVLKKNRLVLDIDDWELREDPRYIFGFYPTSKAEYLTRKIARLADFCIAGSLYLKDYLSQFNNKVYYIPSCVDALKFCPNSRNTKTENVRFAWIGTLHRKDDVENVKFIIDCFREVKRKIKNVSMDIVGDGIYKEEMLSHISNCGLKGYINFLGWIHPDKMPLYLEDIDIGLFPLIQNTRFNLSKSPTKLFEYMSMEKAVVSSCIGEAESIIEDGRDGFLAKNRESFVNKMETLAKDNKLREDMGKNARNKVVQDYSINIAGEKLFTFFMNRKVYPIECENISSQSK